jgi:ketosteroid isomerase-like protein
MPLIKMPKLGKTSKLPYAVEVYINAYNAMDVEGMLACLTDDVVFKNYSGDQLTAEASDKAGFEELARMGVNAFKERKQTIKKAFTMGDTTVLTIQYDAVVAQDLPNGWKAGQKLDFRGASEFRLRDGKIIRITDQS